jgi:hypothetical protein
MLEADERYITLANDLPAIEADNCTGSKAPHEHHHARERFRVVTETMPRVETASIGVWVDAGARTMRPR